MAGNLTSRGPPAAVRLQAGTCEEGRVQEGTSHSEGDQRTRPGCAWGVVSWVSRKPHSTPSNDRWKNGTSSLAYVPLSMCRWWNRSSRGNFFEFISSGPNAMDTFVAAEGPQFKFCPETSQQKKAIRASQGGATTGHLGTVGACGCPRPVRAKASTDRTSLVRSAIDGGK